MPRPPPAPAVAVRSRAGSSESSGHRLLRWGLGGVACLLAVLLAALILWMPPRRTAEVAGVAPAEVAAAAAPAPAPAPVPATVPAPTPAAVTAVAPAGPAPVAAAAQPQASKAVPQQLAPLSAGPAVAPAVAPPLLTLSELLAGHSQDWRIARLRENPAVLVIEFPSLVAQGAAMNRIAALLEKADAPRDRVLSDAELAALIARAGDNAQTFFQGHDYDGAGLARFDALVTRQGQALNPAERRLRRVLIDTGVLRETAGGLQPQGAQAVITFTGTQPDDPTTPMDESVDERRRDSVLRHEASHGRFFTRPVYREHCRRLWREMLTEPQRESLRRHLAAIGYDRRDEELMINEAQALLLHTPDTRAFNAALIGIAEPALAELRTRFWRSLPADAEGPAAPAGGAPQAPRPGA